LKDVLEHNFRVYKWWFKIYQLTLEVDTSTQVILVYIITGLHNSISLMVRDDNSSEEPNYAEATCSDSHKGKTLLKDKNKLMRRYKDEIAI
jgi:hypothetical protein